MNSCSYEDYSSGVSVSSSELVSTPLEPVVDVTQLTPSSTDTFSRPLRLPSRLTAHDAVRVSDGEGGSRVVELIDLVRDARSNPAARSQLLVLAQAAAADPLITSACFIGSPENLLPILAQLGSEDPVARREGSLSLKQLIQSNPEDRRLQLGLLATIDEIYRRNPSNAEARDVLVSVYRDSSPQNAGLRQWMQSHTVAAALSNGQNGNASSSKALSSSAPGAVGGFGFAAAPAGASREGVSGSASTVSTMPVSQAMALPSYAPLAAIVEQRTQGTPLQGLAPEGIVAFALSHANLPANEFKDLLYLRVMATALPLNSFTGAVFGQSAIVATELARDIRRHLNGHEAPASRDARLASASSHGESEALASGSTHAVPAPGPGHAPIVESAPAPLALAPLYGQTGLNAAYNFFVPSLVTSLSGMQALASQPLALGPTSLASQAFGFGGNSSYHIEGPTNLDEDGHQGFGGGSQGQDSGHQDQDGREDSHPQDSYYA